ncbi:EAL domain-containing protein [Pseudorhodoferax sp.]|uniref:bifunctional diguanylate cyclase/phosphodiesterase n=1 Tax=Pseudorhodoferax sp. TaxID=1993553 RepID=UPI0039E62E6C
MKKTAPSFVRALTFHVAGLVVAMGVVLVAAMAWQGAIRTEDAARREIEHALDRSVERLGVLMRAAEMTVDSAVRALSMFDRVDGAVLRPVLESSLSAFEQRPELSYLGIVLPEYGEYGTLERTGAGDVLLWLFPGLRPADRYTRNFMLQDKGFALREERPTDGYDARVRPFYQDALSAPPEGRWIASYRWIVHFEGDLGEPLWGFSYVKSLRDGGGRLLGVLDADFDIPALNRFLAVVSADYDVQLQVVELGREARLVGDARAGRAPLAVPGELAALAGLQGTAGPFVGLADLDGERRWVAARRIELKGGLPWVVVASRKAPLIAGPWRGPLYQVMGAGLATVLALIWASVRMARRFGRPVAALERCVAAIGRSSDQAQPAFAAAVGEFRETQLLGEALGRMANDIRAREHELAAKTAQLLQAKEQEIGTLALKGAIFDSSAAAILSVDASLSVIEWNAAAEGMFGLDREQALGRSLPQAVPAVEGPVDWAANLASTGAATLRLRGAHGPFDAEVRVIALHQGGSAVRTLVVHDISARETAERRLRQERDYADAVLNSLPEVFYHCDEQGRLRRWNRNLERITGATPEALQGIDTLSFFPPEQKALVAERIAEIFRSGETHFEASYLLPSGQRVPCLFTGMRFEHGGVRGFVGVGTDISERKRAEQAVRDSLARFDAVARATGDVVWNWDLKTGDLWWNENFRTLFGYSAQDIESSVDSWSSRIHPDDHDRVVGGLRATVDGDQDTWTAEYRFRRKDGSYAELFDRGYVLRSASGRGVRMVGAIQDVTERKRAERRLRHLATHDALTGLPNRSLLRDRVQQAIAQAGRTGGRLALLFLDLDRFKLINDAYGHPFGDAVLRAAGERVRGAVRPGDTVARHGGDAFLILLNGLADAAEAQDLARQVTECLQPPLVVQGREIHLSGSVGLSVFPEHGEDAQSLIGNADLAMYQAKGLGRNTCQVFTPALGEAAQQRVDLETHLRGAAAAGQLHLVYQPKVSLASGAIIGCEALVRWQHPTLGAVSPGRFIPVAEESGLIVPISDWVLRTACAQAKAWVDAGLAPTPVAVNISARHLLQQDLAAWALQVLREVGLPAGLLELELTESLIAQDVGRVISTFGQLRQAGVRLSIDDFGTGYSSLSYLKHFRVDTLKIDQSFVRNMLAQPEDATIVRAVIALAHSLQFKVIAEGVETAEHCRLLREQGCDQIQGYYIGRPVPAAEFEALLRKGGPLLQP